MKIDSALNSS